MRNVHLYTHGGSYNHGCEAIVRGTKDILASQSNLILFSKNVDSEVSFGVDQLFDVKPHLSYGKEFSTKRILSIVYKKVFNDLSKSVEVAYAPVINGISDGDIAISVGGDMYCYNSYHWMVELNKFLKKKGAHLVLWGCSIEPSALSSDLVDHLHTYDLIVCRESMTYEALLEKNVKTVRLFPDPAFVVKPEEINSAEIPCSKDIIGINVSPLLEVVSGNNIAVKNVMNLIDFILKHTDYGVVLIPHVNHENTKSFSERDFEYMKSVIYSHYAENERVSMVGKHYNARQLKYLISKCRMFLGARTHATIAAYSTLVPTQVIGYSVKSKGIARDIFGDYENYVIPVETLKTENDLIKSFKWLSANEESIREHLKGFIPNYIEKARQAGQEIHRLIDSKTQSS